MRPVKTKTKFNLDSIGIGLSGMCMAHCMATPILLILLPLDLSEGIDGMFHQFIFLGVGPVALLSGIINYKKHKNILAMTALFSGILVLIISLYAEELFVIKAYHLVVTLCGSLLLVVGHWMHYHHYENKHEA